MFYKKYSPAPILQPYVVDYYIWESNGTLNKPFSITAHANGCFAMVFNYGSPYQLSNSSHNKQTLPLQFLSGQSTEAYTLHMNGQIGMAGIIFRGAAFKDLFCLPKLEELLNHRLDLEDSIGYEAMEMSEKLFEATSHLHRVHILDEFLLQRLGPITNEHNLADKAAEMILDHRGMIRMDDLARHLCIGPRQLRRIFKARMGINPKYFARLKRFSYVNLCLTREHRNSWRSFINENAYHDQAHFIKDYKEFFGKSPSLQINENREQAMTLSTV